MSSNPGHPVVFRPSSMGKRHYQGKAVYQSKGSKSRNWKPPITAFSKESYKRSAKRAGCARIAKGFVEDMDTFADHIVDVLMSTAINYTEYRTAKTLLATDLFHALKRHGIIMYGGEEKNTRCIKSLMPKKK